MAHWHDFNPWADVIIYLPDLDELSACLDPREPKRHRLRWEYEQGIRGCDPRFLDAYILPQPSGLHDVGVRYGKEGSEYYSPYMDPYITNLLYDKYRPKS